MRLVYQNGEEGCGIACVAIITNASYKEIKNKLPKYWESKGTTKEQMLRGLHCYGIETSKPKSIGKKDYKKFEFDAVLLGYLDDEMHWTVWDSKREKLLDPYRSKRKFRCTSFIRIERR
jgi:ABC-type bacteriocin/lantibiotic exporter with double-glycine peptidase domain